MCERSRDIVQAYENQNDCIKVICASENKGHLTNVLRTKEKVKKYLYFSDADDY